MNEEILKLAKDCGGFNSGEEFVLRFYKEAFNAGLKAAGEKMEPIPMDKETYTLQLKEAWESGFRCGLREARQEEV